ncbi:MAG: cupin domain-containing protein [Methanosarcinaceae archaeon]|jgi:quercetin dioxygenase-like cupin family protein|nr:cupin domain-containing protein [Methanosarcinaceae archaeon]NKQ38032.1 cupin domain-containing protein [Methanosarcinales archaeon]
MTKHTENKGTPKIVGKIALNDIAEYQDNSVVSRTIIDKSAGTVTFFTFDSGEGLSEHTAPFDALVYIVDGEAEITISGELFSMEKGEMIIMPANEPHALKAIKRFKMLLTMIRPIEESIIQVEHKSECSI